MVMLSGKEFALPWFAPPKAEPEPAPAPVIRSGFDAHKWGLEAYRKAARAALTRRDRGVSHLRELRNFNIPGPGGKLPARLYVPQDAPATGPLLLYFHGGGFVAGDIDTHDSLCHRLAEAAGFRVLSVGYRLAPEHPYPAQLDDALAASNWVKAKSRWLGADRRKLAIGGDSAGAYLAIATAARAPKLFSAQILIYPLLHLDDHIWADSLARNTRVLGRLAVQYISSQLGRDDVTAPSLLNGEPLAPLPTLLAIGGTFDPCAPDSVPYAGRMRDMGAKVEVLEFPDLIHGFANLTHSSRSARAAVEKIGEHAGALLKG
jgi:acetyl esterase